ncbi:hypothetical protein G3545_08590 [Starkeya sp. ORNL1]|uniref:hypothetical protein n=1 Tax=Starkeya sp. ORNL1 TaxID=2709380 RepID=UPI0014634C9C|nr:hypothetical protein [Starkeya sp. ORNL1]QJP13710.1 hypothetical protein G3545_08590 [Starkeya sp. ORNL1]
MKPAVKISTVAMLATLVLGSVPSYGANRYGIACVDNRTNQRINFSVKIGDGQWKPQNLAPGTRRWFTHTYDRVNENSSSSIRVRFDSDLRGTNFSTVYKLTRHTAVADKCDEGYIYAFRYEPRDRRYIDLVPVDGGQLASE